jgi:hypothetical protein
VEIHVSEKRVTEFRDVPPFLFDLLKEIGTAGASMDPRVEGRLYPSPVDRSDDAMIREDWNAFVQPDLQAGFQAARDTVQADLRGASNDAGLWTLEIPANHIEAWLNALNQARLAISEENHFGENELAEELSLQPESSRDRALLQMHFYGMIQEWFVRILD